MSYDQAYVRQIIAPGKPASRSPAWNHGKAERLSHTLPVLLVGHGSRAYPDAGRILFGHAAALRQAGYGVAVGFLNGNPPARDAALALGDGRISVVPFFMEDGYFTRVAIPRALDGLDVQVCPPVGLHPALPGIITRLAEDGCARSAILPQDAAIVVIGHGSASAPGRALALYDHARRVADTGPFRAVHPACLEEPPFVADVLASLRRDPVVVVGYFANEASHVQEDVPALLQAEREARGADGPPVAFAGIVAQDRLMQKIIVTQAGLMTA